MTINLTVPQTMQELRPRITVVGVGGAGCNAVNNMINANLEGVDFLVLNTDGQALAHSLSSRKIQLGSTITQGLGAGSKPEVGYAAAEESLQEVMAELADCNMVFITAGMGGGTGTGAAPVIARAARERGILTVGVVTKPFEFEGQRRMKQAETGIEEMQAYVDTLIVIPNQNLFRLANERTTFADAFHMADAVLHQGVCGVTDLMIKPGQINLDFADIRTVMGEMGKAMMGTGEATGETRATQAAEAAINNPLLDDTTMKGASAVLINVTGGLDMTLFEVDEAANRIRKEVDPDATIIFGSAFDDKLDGVMRVSVVATGICNGTQHASHPVTTKPVNAIAAKPNLEAPNIQPAAINLAPMEMEMPMEISGEVSGEVLAETSVEMPGSEATVSGDIESRISNEIANEAIDLASDQNIGQMNIGHTGDTGVSLFDTMPGDAAQMPLTADTAPAITTAPETATARAHFIPSPPASMPDEETITQAAQTTIQRPTSLMNKISGLWTTKPQAEAVADTAQRSEPSLNEAESKAQIAVSILDLSRAYKDNDRTDTGSFTTQNSDDEALDIPAFLRRQAN